MSTQKQCPKCGEKNPAEAVMCWACYTSLSGGAAAGTMPAGGAPATAMADSGDKKKIEPKQLAIIGVALVVLLGIGAKTMMGGGGTDEEPLPTFNGTKPSPTTTNPPPTTNTGGGGQPPVAVPGGQPAPVGPTGGPAQGPPFPYTLASAPNPRERWATMAIVPNQGELKESQAKDLAQFANRYQQKMRKFPAVEIFVINNAQAAGSFAEYQLKRGGLRMQESDYRALQNVWGSTPVRYVVENGKASFSSPQRDPSGFWTSNSNG